LGNATSACCQHRSLALYTESLVSHPGKEQTRPSSSAFEGGGRCPGRVPFVTASLLPGDSPTGADRFARMGVAAREPLGGRVRAPREDRAHALRDLGRDVAAAALVAEHLLEPPLELGVAVARGALPEVHLDLHALHADELSVEIELDLPKHALAVSP
jgi:hypothetical protein